jgi:Flp pilus assembly protein TadD
MLRESCDALRRIGDRAYLSTHAAELADALLLLGNDEEAGRWCSVSEEIGAEDDVIIQIGWRTAKAKLLARGGKLSAAETLAREAVTLIEPTDALNLRAKTLLDLSDVLRHAHRVDEAREAVEEALMLFSRKENTAGASRAQSRLAELAPA